MKPDHALPAASPRDETHDGQHRSVDPFHELDKFQSAPFRRAIDQVRRFARDGHATILVEGESGTGKTHLARLIHAASPRATRAFELVVLSAIEDNLVGSALFGHVRGAFTDASHPRLGHFASANGGTLFLDEIGKASLAVQQKLLHVIEAGEFRPLGADRDTRVDVRVIAASNVSLEDSVDEGRFLPDLFARLQVFRVCLPSLRERRADIPRLVQQMLAVRAARAASPSVPQVDEELMNALRQAPWKYNLRGLDGVLHRLYVDSGAAPILTLQHCTGDLAYLRTFARARPTLTPDIARAAVAAERSVSAAARALGVDRTTIHRHLRARTSLPPVPRDGPTSDA